ncbi:MAG: SRPBCC family protein [Bdellovibrionales bacterium]|nr:SRPBCC family protein [Bdellovibrionales bacterium]
MTMKKVLLGLLGLLLLGLAALAFKASRVPTHYSIPVTRELPKSCDQVFDLVAQLDKWESWSPWKKYDAETRYKLDSAQITGPGAKLSWESKKTGNGSARITDFRQGTMLQYELSFEGWDSKSMGQFDLVATGPSVCKTTWTMSGDNPFLGKVFWIVFNFENAIMKDFNDGLANIAALK